MKEFIPKNLVDAQAHLAAIIASSDDAIVSKNLNGNITSWNQGAERIFGYTEEEVIGKHIGIIIPPEFIGDEDLILSRIRAGERVDHFETTRRAKDGRYINLSVTISPIRNEEGKIVGASKVARDITGLKEAERVSAYLGAIVESSDDAIISKDLSGFITSWNSSAERIFGYSAIETIGCHITLIIPSDRLEEEEKIIRTLKAGERIDHFETVRRHKDGRPVYVSITVSPIRTADGKVVGASKVARDISERLKAESFLKELGRKKDEFLANMSHELRTPMNAVIGLASLLQHSKILPAKERKFVDTLKLSADSLMELINDILDFAKIESGSVQLEDAEFDLGELIRNAVSIIEVKAREKNLTVAVTHDPALNLFFKGDQLRVHQILMNLLSNAVKFTDQGSIGVHIKGQIDAETGEAVTALSVRDTGIGIPYDKQADIFEKFTQGDASVNRRFGGSGLGLTISKSLAELMGGSIGLESEPGVGSTFTLTLPLKKGERQEAAKAEAFPEKRTIRKDVLLVEDYEPNVLVATAMLEEFGYAFDVAHNGLEALRKFRDGKYDIILMDVQMRDLDGLETTRRIRRMEKETGSPPTAIVAMTAHVREHDKHQCIDAGMDDFISKPFNSANLAQTIALYTQQHEMFG